MNRKTQADYQVTKKLGELDTAKLERIERGLITVPGHYAESYTNEENWDYQCSRLRHYPGVYIVSWMPIRFEDEKLLPLYVGFSGDIRERFYSHKKLKRQTLDLVTEKNGVFFISLALEKFGFNSFTSLEQFLINSLTPAFNKAI